MSEESKIIELPDEPTASSSASTATPVEAEMDPADDAELAPAYDDGDLPDFSDDETVHAAADASGAANGAPTVRTVPPSRPKGPPGRKKVPFAALKAKLNNSNNSAPAKKAATSAPSPPPVESKKAGKAKETPPTSAVAAPSTSAGANDDSLQEFMANLMKGQKGADGTDLGGGGGEGFKAMDIEAFMKQLGINKDYLQGKSGLMGKGTKDMASHKFWSTQPVQKLDTPTDQIKEGPLEKNKKVDEIPTEPVTLHKDFKWVTMDLKEADQLTEVYRLLSAHYVEDVDASFRFDYPVTFLEWALKPPGYVQDWHVGIRVAATGKLVGFIAGIPMDTRIRNVIKRTTEINFLCVHKKLRTKRLAPLLIQEVTRRTHLKGIFQAVYTAGVFLPTPVTRCQYHHRALNTRKLVDTGFSPVPRGSTVSRLVARNKLPEETSITGIREMQKKDLKQVARLLRAYLGRLDLAPVFSNGEIEHALLGGRGQDVDGKRHGQVVWTWVVEEPGTNRITDFFSYYTLPSTACKVKTPTVVNAAYLFYYATTAAASCTDLGDGSSATKVKNWSEETVEERAVLKKRLAELVTDAMVLAQKQNFDVMNALTLADNSLFLEDLKFGRGDGFLHYYLYNYQTQPIKGGIDKDEGGSGVGLVML